MAIRKNISTETLAKVIEFTVTELQKDLSKYTTEQNKMLNNHASFVQRELNKEIPINTEKLEYFVKGFEKKLEQNINYHVTALEQQKKEMRIFYVSLIFFLFGFACIITSYIFSVKGISNTRSDYYKELQTEGKIIENEQEKEFLKTWREWSKKNPKDSKQIKEIIKR